MCVLCLRHDQELLKLYLNLSIVDRMLKRYGSAIAYAKKALYINGDSAKAYYQEAKVITSASPPVNVLSVGIFIICSIIFDQPAA